MRCTMTGLGEINDACRPVIIGGTGDLHIGQGDSVDSTEPSTTSRTRRCLPSDQVQHDAPAVPQYRGVTLQESRVLGALTDCRATSRRRWYLPYALVGVHGRRGGGLRLAGQDHRQNRDRGLQRQVSGVAPTLQPRTPPRYLGAGGSAHIRPDGRSQ